ncbi:MAG TPA: alpha-galactosidase [Pseudomonadales bacterium]|nr:alpha-galactosidase [Pseudomonadales bacterium]
MTRIAIIGAGSLVFSSRLTADILTYPQLRDAHFALVDVDAERLAYAGRIVERICRDGGYDRASFSLHRDRAKALAGADVVIISILVGGYAAIEREIDIPKRYGVDQAIGDTLTPGGIMRCLRTLPVLVEIGRDVMTHCPDAWVLNYTNPMAMLCWGMKAALPDLRLVGLCHSVQHTTAQWAYRLKVPLDEIDFECAGLNHQAWIFRFDHRGHDLLPRIRELAVTPALWRKDTSRMEYVKHFGYPVTEASGHNSEYSAWFRKRPELIAAYCPGGSWNGGSGFIKALYNRPDWRDTMEKMANGTEPVSLERSNEYGSQIVSALAGGETVKIYGNVANDGYIDNLPSEACVEVPCRVDSAGIEPIAVGRIPDHLAAINQTQVNVQRLAVKAALDSDPECAFQAMALDPLTGAVGTLDDIRAMTAELLAAHAEWLPAFSNRPLAAKPRMVDHA